MEKKKSCPDGFSILKNLTKSVSLEWQSTEIFYPRISE